MSLCINVKGNSSVYREGVCRYSGCCCTTVGPALWSGTTNLGRGGDGDSGDAAGAGDATGTDLELGGRSTGPGRVSGLLLNEEGGVEPVV